MTAVSPMGLLIVIALALVVIAVPMLMIVAAMRGGPNLPRIAAVAVYLVMAATTVAMMGWIGALLSGGALTLTVPVEPLQPQVATGVKLDPAPLAVISEGGFDRVTVTATGFSFDTRLTLAAAWLIGGLTILAVSVMLLRLIKSLAAADPFRMGAKTLVASGWIVLLGGTVATAVGDLGAAMASSDLFASAAVSFSGGDAGPSWPESASFGLTLPVWPLGAALVLALLAAVFRHGEQLRSDAEGLI